jgi:thiamine-monophosphate kinase
VALIESEAGLIARLRDLFHTSFQTEVQVGIGDDAAVIKSSNNKLVATVDMAVEGIHFHRKWSSPFQIGAKLTTANLADIFAMGAVPKYLLVAAGINELNNSETVSELAKGIRSVADKFEVSVIGGDLSKSEKMTLSITALGELSAQPILRSGGRVGDIIYLSSLTGLSAAGLAILNRDLDRPRYFKDLAELAKELNEDVFDWILTGGEDHFFLATVDKKNESSELGIKIGIVEKGDGKLLLDGIEVKESGYQHF